MVDIEPHREPVQQLVRPTDRASIEENRPITERADEGRHQCRLTDPAGTDEGARSASLEHITDALQITLAPDHRHVADDTPAAGRVFTRPQKTVWRCRNCGYLHTGDAAPEKCPACVKPQSYFELLAENW